MPIGENAGGIYITIDADSSPLIAKYAAVATASRTAGEKIGSALTSPILTEFGKAQKAVTDLSGNLISEMVPAAQKAAAASTEAAVAIKSVGAAAEGTVPQISAMSGAIRVLSGEQSIRAIERFGVSLGLGGAAVAAFPLIGLLAIGELVSRVAGHFDKLSESEKAFTEESKRATEEAKRQSEAFDRLEVSRAKLEIGGIGAQIVSNFFAGTKAAEDQAALDSETAKLQRMTTQLSAAKKEADSLGTIAGAAFSYTNQIDKQTDAIKAQQIVVDGLSDSVRQYNLAQKPLLDAQLAQQKASNQGALESAQLSNQGAALTGEMQRSAAIRSIQESQVHAENQVRIDAMHDRQAAAVAEAAEEVRIAKQKESDITADQAAELPKRIALIQQEGQAKTLGKDKDEIPAIEAETAGKVAAVKRDSDQKILEAHAATISAEQRLDEANSTHAREMYEYVKKAGTETWDEIGKSLKELEAKQNEFFDKFVADQARVSEIQDKAAARVGEIGAKGSASTGALGIEKQKLEAAQAYDLQIVHTAQDQIAFAQRQAQLEAQARAAKIAGIQQELAIAQQAESVNRERLSEAVNGSEEQVAAAEAEAATRERVATIQQQINELESAGANAEIEAQTKILVLKQKESLAGQIIGKVGTGPGSLVDAANIQIANTTATAIDGISAALGRAAQGGQSLSKIMQQLGKSILGEIVSGIVKIGLQMAVTAAIGKSATAAMAATEAAEAAGLGAAWAFVSVLAALPFPANIAAAPGIAAAEGAQILAIGVPKFDKGGPINEDQLAMVHKGEYVLTADQVSGRTDIPSFGGGGIGSAPFTNTMSVNSASSAFSIGAIHLHGVRDMQDVARRLPNVLKAASSSFQPASR